MNQDYLERDRELREQLDYDLSLLAELLLQIAQLRNIIECEGVITDFNVPPDVIDDYVSYDSNGNKSLVTEYHTPGNFVFDWQNTTLEEGYLKEFVECPDSSDFVYLNIAHKYDQKQRIYPDVSTDSWIFHSGRVVTESDFRVYDDISRLVSVIHEYRAVKEKYEVTDMYALLELEKEYMLPK